jgi:DNA-binding FadR family transcriptional regulator
VLLNSFNDLLRRYFTFSYHGPENALGTANQHQRILDAIKAHDAGAAIEALRDHMSHSQKDLLEARRLESTRESRQSG